MQEPLTLELAVELLRDLSAAFPQKMDDKAMIRRAEVYRNNLQGVSGSALRWAVKASIQEDNFFPKVARLRELATRWTVANTPAQASLPVANRQCSHCNSPFEWRKQWRPKVTENGWGVVVTDGDWLMLASYERLLCKCDPVSPYFPDIEAPGREPAMRIRTPDGAPNVSLSLIQRIADDQRRTKKPAPPPIEATMPRKSA